MKFQKTTGIAARVMAAGAAFGQCGGSQASACSGEKEMAATMTVVSYEHTGDHAPSQDIVQTAVGAGSFKTLVAAVQAAGLVETLKGDGPFTVFAPTDEAFAKLAPGTVQELLKPENKERLASILKLHVVPARVYADQAAKLTEAETLGGLKVKIDINEKHAMVGNANIIATDIEASNGVVHVLDTVLLPCAAAMAGACAPPARWARAFADRRRSGLVCWGLRPRARGGSELRPGTTQPAPAPTRPGRLPAGTEVAQDRPNRPPDRRCPVQGASNCCRLSNPHRSAGGPDDDRP